MLRPCPPAGEWTCAASPARNTRPSRKRSASAARGRKSEAQRTSVTSSAARWERAATSSRTPVRARGPAVALRELAPRAGSLRARQRADREEAVAAVAGGKTCQLSRSSAGDPDVGHQHRAGSTVSPVIADAERAAHRASGRRRRRPRTRARTVAAGGEARPSRRPRPGSSPVSSRPKATSPPSSASRASRISWVRHCGTIHGSRVRLGLRRLRPASNMPVLALPARRPARPSRPGSRAAGRADRVQHAEVVEDLHGARLDALAARAGEQRVRPLDDERVARRAGRGRRPRASPVGPAPTTGRPYARHRSTLLNVVKFHVSREMHLTLLSCQAVRAAGNAVATAPRPDPGRGHRPAAAERGGPRRADAARHRQGTGRQGARPVLALQGQAGAARRDGHGDGTGGWSADLAPSEPPARLAGAAAAAKRGLRRHLLRLPGRREGLQRHALHRTRARRADGGEPARCSPSAGFTRGRGRRARGSRRTTTRSATSSRSRRWGRTRRRREGFDLAARAARLAAYPLVAAAGEEIFARPGGGVRGGVGGGGGGGGCGVAGRVSFPYPPSPYGLAAVGGTPIPNHGLRPWTPARQLRGAASGAPPLDPPLRPSGVGDPQ